MKANRFRALANKTKLFFVKANELDLVDSYPGFVDESGNKIPSSTKLLAAKKEIVNDINSIASQYHMWAQQEKEARNNVLYYRIMFESCKKLQEAINSVEGNVDVSFLNETINKITNEAKSMALHLGLKRKIQPSELTSYRLIQALIAEDTLPVTPHDPEKHINELKNYLLFEEKMRKQKENEEKIKKEMEEGERERSKIDQGVKKENPERVKIRNQEIERSIKSEEEIKKELENDKIKSRENLPYKPTKDSDESTRQLKPLFPFSETLKSK